MNEREIVAEFRQAMSGAGLRTSTRIVPDGKLQRFHVEGDRKGSRNGWAVLHDDPPAGAFGSWKSRRKDTWSAKGARALTPVERDRMVTRIQEDSERHEKELAERRTRGAQRAREEWEGATPAAPTHPYLAKKGVEPHGLKQAGSVILLPLRDVNGDLHGLQRIYEDGTKKFTTGTWKQGHFHLIGDVPTDRVWVAEGFATAATVHEATRDPVAVAVDCSNLRPVAEALRGKFPGVEIVIAGDDDRATEGNPGRTHAIEAAFAVNGLVAIPELSADEGTDWNDYAKLHGQDAVREKLGQAGPPRSTEWPDVPDLPGSPDPDPLPLDTLPPVLRDMAATISGSTQAPLDSAIGAVIGAVSVAAVGKISVEICPRREWIKPAHTYVGIEQHSGTGKSPLINAVRAPIVEWEAMRARREARVRNWNYEQVQLAEATVKAIRTQLAKGTAPTKGRRYTKDDLEMARIELDAAKTKPHMPFQLMIQDCTEEELVRIMASNHGRVAAIDAEATILELAAGRYGNGDARLAALTHGWDGDAMRVNRVTRDPVDVPSANLALLLGIQPGILTGMMNAETMKQRGVLARFLWIAPPIRWDDMRVGAEVPPVDRRAVAQYEKTLLTILNKSDKSEGGPYLLKMSPEAQEGVYRLEQARIDGMRPGGRLESVPAFAGKLPDHGARIAALLTVADRASNGEDLFLEPIPGVAMEASERLIAAISTHVVKVIGDAGGDPQMLDLAYLLDLCTAMAGSSESEIRERARGRDVFRKAKYSHECFDHLERRGCIRRVIRPRTATSGRDPSPQIEVHPTLAASDLSDFSEESAQKTQWGNKSDKSEGHAEPQGDPDLGGAVEPEGLSDEGRQCLDGERVGTQMEEYLPEDPVPAQQDNASPPDTVQAPHPELDLWPEGTQEAGDAEARSEGFL